jgi:hypothetical protein
MEYNLNILLGNYSVERVGKDKNILLSNYPVEGVGKDKNKGRCG